MSRCEGTFGLYPWFLEHGTEMIHPSDYHHFSILKPYGKVFQCVGESERYLVLRYGLAQYRVKPDLYQPIPKPPFVIGEPVRVKDDPNLIGVVCDINWHHQKSSPIFFLEINGKRRSRRFFQDELESIEHKT